jgi:hypothetical protein
MKRNDCITAKDSIMIKKEKITAPNKWSRAFGTWWVVSDVDLDSLQKKANVL